MKKWFKTFLLYFAFVIAISCFFGAINSCTENDMARNFGGTQTINLKAGEKLVNVTWKEVNLWILTEKMSPEDVAKTYSFKEKSSHGIMEGEIIIIEHK